MMPRTSPASNSTSTAAWANCEPANPRWQNLEGEKDDRREDRPGHQLYLCPRRAEGGLDGVPPGPARRANASEGQVVPAEPAGVGGPGDVTERGPIRQGHPLPSPAPGERRALRRRRGQG